MQTIRERARLNEEVDLTLRASAKQLGQGKVQLKVRISSMLFRQWLRVSGDNGMDVLGRFIEDYMRAKVDAGEEVEHD
jgi:hypothetical protein